MRSLARESVYKFIFSRLFNQNDEGLFDVLIKDLSNDDKDFATKLLNCIMNKYEEYIEDIQKLAVNYKFDRILNPDKCAILIGMAELDNFDTPVPVAIDEAVKLSAIYSTEKSTDFVNGVLAEFNKGKSNENNWW